VLGDELFIEQVLQQKLSLSPLAWPLVYQYPVQQIGPSFLPQTAPDQPSYLIVYRDTDDQVHFMQTTPMTYRLLQLIEENDNISGQRSLHALATEMSQQFDTQMLMQFGLQTLQELAAKGIIIPAAAV
jgi:hypothetical protein